MDIGKLRHRLAIQEAVETQDAHGGIAYAWSTATTVWGRIETLSMRERVNAEAVQSQATHRITIRGYTGLTPRHRILFGTRVFNIDGIQDVEERGATMIATCIEMGESTGSGSGSGSGTGSGA